MNTPQPLEVKQIVKITYEVRYNISDLGWTSPDEAKKHAETKAMKRLKQVGFAHENENGTHVYIFAALED